MTTTSVSTLCSAPSFESLELTLASHYECPVCFDRVMPPILQCPAGHLICGSCRDKLAKKECPTCRHSLEGVPVRNLALEKIAQEVLLPCKFNCGEFIYWDLKDEHEGSCRMKVFNCPLPQCPFQGTIDAICIHFKIDHEIICGGGESVDKKDCWIGVPESINIITGLSTDGNEVGSFSGYLMNCYQHIFLVVIRKNYYQSTAFYGNEYQASVMLIGPPEEAENFIYRMVMEKDGRRSIWESTTQQVNKSVAEAFNDGDCLFVHPSTAKFMGSKQAPEDEVEIFKITVSIHWKPLVEAKAAEDLCEFDELPAAGDYETPMEDNTDP